MTPDRIEVDVAMSNLLLSLGVLMVTLTQSDLFNLESTLDLLEERVLTLTKLCRQHALSDTKG